MNEYYKRKRKRNKKTEIKQKEPTKLNKQAPHPHTRAKFRKKQERTEKVPTKPRRKKTTFKAAVAVCGAGSLGRCLLVDLVPYYPVRDLLPALVNRGFPATVTPRCYFLEHQP